MHDHIPPPRVQNAPVGTTYVCAHNQAQTLHRVTNIYKGFMLLKFPTRPMSPIHICTGLPKTIFAGPKDGWKKYVAKSVLIGLLSYFVCF